MTDEQPPSPGQQKKGPMKLGELDGNDNLIPSPEYERYLLSTGQRNKLNELREKARLPPVDEDGNVVESGETAHAAGHKATRPDLRPAPELKIADTPSFGARLVSGAFFYRKQIGIGIAATALVGLATFGTYQYLTRPTSPAVEEIRNTDVTPKADAGTMHPVNLDSLRTVVVDSLQSLYDARFNILEKKIDALTEHVVTLTTVNDSLANRLSRSLAQHAALDTVVVPLAVTATDSVTSPSDSLFASTSPLISKFHYALKPEIETSEELQTIVMKASVSGIGAIGKTLFTSTDDSTVFHLAHYAGVHLQEENRAAEIKAFGRTSSLPYNNVNDLFYSAQAQTLAQELTRIYFPTAENTACTVADEAKTVTHDEFLRWGTSATAYAKRMFDEGTEDEKYTCLMHLVQKDPWKDDPREALSLQSFAHNGKNDFWTVDDIHATYRILQE